MHEFIINRMSASTAIELKFGEHTLALSADGSTYDFVLPASTSGLDNSVDTLTATAENAGAKVKISDVADHVIPADATKSDFKEGVAATEPEPAKLYVHVVAEDGSKKTYTVKLGKLTKNATIGENGVSVATTGEAVAATYDRVTNTYSVRLPYSESGANITVQPNS